jgi:hypothetical protein
MIHWGLRIEPHMAEGGSRGVPYAALAAQQLATRGRRR